MRWQREPQLPLARLPKAAAANLRRTLPGTIRARFIGVFSRQADASSSRAKRQDLTEIGKREGESATHCDDILESIINGLEEEVLGRSERLCVEQVERSSRRPSTHKAIVMVRRAPLNVCETRETENWWTVDFVRMARG